MFTGIVQAVGKIVRLAPLEIEAGALGLRDVRVGDSVMVQGACLTVVRKRGKRLSFDVSAETLECTTGLDRPGGVNLEKALRLADRLGGHLVSGHVDGLAELIALHLQARPGTNERIDVAHHAIFNKRRGGDRADFLQQLHHATPSKTPLS